MNIVCRALEIWMAHIPAQIRKAGIYIFSFLYPLVQPMCCKCMPQVIKSGPDLTVSGYACRLKEPSECRNNPLHWVHSVTSDTWTLEEIFAVRVYLLYAQVIIPAQFKHIFGQDNDSVFMSFRFKDIHRPIKQVDILSSEPSGFYGSETATVDQAKYYRYHQMFCGCSKAGLQRIYFLEQLRQIFLWINVGDMASAFLRELKW